MKTRYYIFVMTLFLAFNAFAQSEIEALRYSQVYPIGTARYTAMGGAFGAIGGDFTSASTNPAGLGLYRNSEFSISPSYISNTSESNYLGEINRDKIAHMGLSSLGMITSGKTGSSEGVVSTVLAFGYNTLNEFNSSTLMQGTQALTDGTSLLDNFAYYANNSSELDPLYEGIAYETGLLPQDPADSVFWHDFQPGTTTGYSGYGQHQMRVVNRSGYIGEYLVSGAVNIDDRLYVGVTGGIHAVRFYEDIYHRESDLDDLTPVLNSFGFSEYSTTRGYGYVLKLGMIFKPIHILRLGAAVQAPVTYRLTDEKQTDLHVDFDSNSGYPDTDAEAGPYAKNYSLKTPLRASLSAAIVLGQLGIISAEYEYVDYTTADLDSRDYGFNVENAAIKGDFRQTHNLKAGAELRLKPVYLRAGAQYYMSPFDSSVEANSSDIFIASGGIGFRSGQTYLDVTMSRRYIDSQLYGLYYANFDTGAPEISINSYRANSIILTLGYKF